MKLKPRNLVHKNSVEFNKPKTFRDRKNDYSRKNKKEEWHDGIKPKHRPYSREAVKDYLEEDESEYEEEGEYEEESEHHYEEEVGDPSAVREGEGT